MPLPASWPWHALLIRQADVTMARHAVDSREESEFDPKL